MKYLLLVEGEAERAVMDILLDNNSLLFSREELIDEKVFKTLKINNEVERTLNLAHSEKIKIIRIMDSINKKIKIPMEYEYKLELPCEDYATKPEIEILYIINEGDYDDFQKCKSGKNKMKPSQYCAKEYKGYHKGEQYWTKYWSDHNALIDAIKIHKQKSDGTSKTIFELLK